MKALDPHWEEAILEHLDRPENKRDLDTLKAVAEGPQDVKQLETSIKRDVATSLAWLCHQGLAMTGLRRDLTTRVYNVTILGRIILSHFEQGDWVIEQRLLRLYRAAIRLVGDPKRATEWLREPNVRLNGAIPLEAIHAEVATVEVEAEVFRIQHGVY
jgi:hypothetical protein